MVLLSGQQDGEEYEIPIELRICSEEELLDLYEPTLSAKKEFDEFLNDDDRVLYCFDWDDENMYFQGDRHSDDFRRLEINFTPCNYLYS